MSESNPKISTETSNLISRRKFVRNTAGIVLASYAGLFGRGFDADTLRVRRTDVHLPRWPAEADGITIGLLSDFHADYEEAIQRTARAAMMLVAERPDIIVVAGDYVSTQRCRPCLEPTIEALRPLTKTQGGAYAVMGNHDYWGNNADAATHLLRQTGFTVLNNLSIPFPGVPGAFLVGLDDAWYRKMDVQKALHGIPKDAPKIVVLHEPDFADSIGPWFDLQVSGHSHGGQVRLPGLPVFHAPPYGRKYPEGLQQAKNHLVYTTHGVGMIGPQIRTWCPPEVTVLTLRTIV